MEQKPRAAQRLQIAVLTERGFDPYYLKECFTARACRIPIEGSALAAQFLDRRTPVHPPMRC